MQTSIILCLQASGPPWALPQLGLLTPLQLALVGVRTRRLTLMQHSVETSQNEMVRIIPCVSLGTSVIVGVFGLQACRAT